MGYDEEILECIKEKFKNVKQISDETGISISRVTTKMPVLERYNLIISMQGQSCIKGAKPRLFKKK